MMLNANGEAPLSVVVVIAVVAFAIGYAVTPRDQKPTTRAQWRTFFKEMFD